MNLKTTLLGVACATTLFACAGKSEIKKADFNSITANAKEKHGAYKTVNVTIHYEVTVNGKTEKKDGQGVFSLDEEIPWKSLFESEPIVLIPNYKVTTPTGIEGIDETICEYYNFSSVYTAKVLIAALEEEGTQIDIKYYKNPLGMNFDFGGMPCEVEYGNDDYIATKLKASVTNEQNKMNITCNFKGSTFVNPPQLSQR